MITIILVVYKTKVNQLRYILKNISSKYKVIIIDNSENYDFSKFKITNNIKIVRSKNIGNGAAQNKGFKLCKTEKALCMDTDVILPKNFIEKMINKSKHIKNFSILIPNHGNIKNKSRFVEKYSGEASVMLFNLKKYKNKKIFDENFFLYFEEVDLFFQCKKKKLKVFFIPDIKIKHLRANSIDQNNLHIKNLRAWHYMWSMFFYLKKNYNFYETFKKTTPLILKDVVMMGIYLFLIDKNKFLIRFYRLYGIMSSIIGLKSFLR